MDLRVCLPVFFRCTSLELPENAIEGLLIVEAGFDCHARDIHIRINEKGTGITDPQ